MQAAIGLPAESYRLISTQAPHKFRHVSVSAGRPNDLRARTQSHFRDHGAASNGKARQRERDLDLPDGTTHAGRTPAH